MNSIDLPPPESKLDIALNNPLLTETAALPAVDRFNVSAFSARTPLHRVEASIPKVTARAQELVSLAWQRLEAAPAAGIHLEVGAGAKGASSTMFVREEWSEHFYSPEAPFISVDGLAEQSLSGSAGYVDSSIQEGIRESFAELNAKMARQGRSEEIQYRVGSGNDLAAAGIETESVAELYIANVLLACSLSNQEMYEMLAEFHRVMKPGAHLMIQENSGQMPSAVSRGGKDDLHPTRSRGSTPGLAAALDAAGFTERGIDPKASSVIVAFKTSPETAKPKRSLTGLLGRINKRY